MAFKGKRVYFLDNVEAEKDNLSNKVSIQIEAKTPDSQWTHNVKINFLRYLSSGSITESDDLRLAISFNESMNVKFLIDNVKEENSIRRKRYLRFIYHFYDHKPKSTSILLGDACPINEPQVLGIAKIISSLLNFCKKNILEIKEFGFRANLNHKFMSLENKKYEFIENIINLKFYLKETSETRVGKDNVFRDYMVINYTKYDNLYFVKLMHDFFGSSAHDKTDMTFTTFISESKYWSASFNDKLTEQRFDNQRAKLIEYIIQNFNIENGLKISLLNIDF